MNAQLVKYYTQDGLDAAGRTYARTMRFTPTELEEGHDFVQWLLPTQTMSQCNGDAPVLDAETIKALKSSVAFQVRFSKAVALMLNFWEIEFIKGMDDKINIRTLKQTRYPWSYSRDHNHLRMARMMESCRLLGMPETAKDLFETLLAFSNTPFGTFITPTNIYYWYIAAFGKQI